MWVSTLHAMINTILQLPCFEFSVNRQRGKESLLQMTGFMNDQCLELEIFVNLTCVPRDRR